MRLTININCHLITYKMPVSDKIQVMCSAFCEKLIRYIFRFQLLHRAEVLFFLVNTLNHIIVMQCIPTWEVVQELGLHKRFSRVLLLCSVTQSIRDSAWTVCLCMFKYCQVN